jgi:hypothetical protein
MQQPVPKAPSSENSQTQSPGQLDAHLRDWIDKVIVPIMVKQFIAEKISKKPLSAA